MVTARASVSREDDLLTTSSLIRTILVVEHDPDKGESFTQLLPCKPHQYVKWVGSGAAALNFVTHIKPDLFLLTYRLPDIDGLTLYDLLQRQKDSQALLPSSSVSRCPNRLSLSSRRSSS